MAVAKGGTDDKDVTELFDLLESNDTEVVSEIKQLIQENLSSTRESWVLKSLLDYYYVSQSERTMELLAGVREPHDKHLFDKLNDGLKHINHKLLTLRLLLFTVIKQPSWIHKLVQSSVFNSIIRCLKHDLDIPTLMTGVLVITNYLPIEPVSITSHLNEIFDIFTRLLTFSKKKTGNIPDIFLLHLQVAVYALFHRLYGMFPCNFLAYLRHYFLRREHHDVYQDVLKPMIERVRLHPLLITGSKEYESTHQRWRKMEIQDIVVDCARVSLDVIEGTGEEVRCPVIAPRYHLFPRLVSQQSSTPSLPGQTAQNNVPLSVDSSLPYMPMYEPSVLWSPSAVCGLSTPPPNQLTSSQAGSADYTTSIQHSYQGTSYTNTPLLTPSQTPRATPPVIVDDLFDRSRNSRSNLSKRLSGSSLPSPKLQMCSSNIGQTSFDSLSVPPSPLRPEFTSEPPIGTHRTQPLPRAAQKLPFDDIPERASSHYDSGFSHHNLSHKLDSAVVEKFQTLSRETIAESPIPGDLSDSGSDMKMKSQSDPSNLNSQAEPPGDRGRALSIKVVDKVVQEMSEVNDNADDTDEEVREIIQEDISDKLAQSESSDKIEANLELTAESVQRFMRKVNRIRFNSLTIGTSVDVMADVVQRAGQRSRSISCPNLHRAVPEQSPCQEPKSLRCSSAAPQHNLSQQAPTNGQSGRHSDNGVAMVTSYDMNSVTNHGGESLVSDSIQGTAPSVVPSGAGTEHSSLKASQGHHDLDPNPHPIQLSTSEKEENAVIDKLLPRPFDRILQYSLPYSAITRCQQCKRRYVTAMETTDLHCETLPKADYETPLFSTFSPPELLDRHLQLGGEVHAKELSRIPITSQDSINWTHFGGLPPADEINILRGQILLIQNQVMYERHKRELHAKRNRRLLSKITHAKALEERNSALLDQLRLQENEIQSLQVSMKLLQQENQKLKGNKESDCYEQQVQLRASLADNAELKFSRSELQSQLENLRLEKAEALKMLQQAEFQLFNTLRDLETLKGQAAITKELHEQVARLNKELLLMGELQQRYQAQLAMKDNQKPKVERDYQFTSLHAEIKALKRQLDQKHVQTTGMQKKVLELEETIKYRDITQTDLKRSLEMVKSSHQEEIKSVESKYQSSVKIGQQLESHIMDLYGQIETLKRATRQRGSVKVSSEVPMRGQDNPGNANPALSSDTTQSDYSSQSETLLQRSNSPGQKGSNRQTLGERSNWPPSPASARAARDSYPVLSQQLASSASLFSQSDAFSVRGPLLNQSTEEESAPAQTIVMDTRRSPGTHRTPAFQRLNVIGSHSDSQSKYSSGLDTDVEHDSSTSSGSNTLCDSGMDSHS